MQVHYHSYIQFTVSHCATEHRVPLNPRGNTSNLMRKNRAAPLQYENHVEFGGVSPQASWGLRHIESFVIWLKCA